MSRMLADIVSLFKQLQGTRNKKTESYLLNWSMIPEMPALIPLQNSSHRLKRKAAMTQPTTPQVGSQITESDNDMRVDKQMLLVKWIRTLLGREITKLQIEEAATIREHQ